MTSSWFSCTSVSEAKAVTPVQVEEQARVDAFRLNLLQQRRPGAHNCHLAVVPWRARQPLPAGSVQQQCVAFAAGRTRLLGWLAAEHGAEAVAAGTRMQANVQLREVKLLTRSLQRGPHLSAAGRCRLPCQLHGSGTRRALQQLEQLVWRSAAACSTGVGGTMIEVAGAQANQGLLDARVRNSGSCR